MFKSALPFAALLGLVAMPAAAQPAVSEVTVQARPRADVEIRTKVVSYRDLNIQTPEGAQTLLGRIRQASEVVCTPAPDVKNFTEYRDYERCKSEAIDGAVAQAKSPDLATLYSRVR